MHGGMARQIGSAVAIVALAGGAAAVSFTVGLACLTGQRRRGAIRITGAPPEEELDLLDDDEIWARRLRLAATLVEEGALSQHHALLLLGVERIVDRAIPQPSASFEDKQRWIIEAVSRQRDELTDEEVAWLSANRDLVRATLREPAALWESGGGTALATRSRGIEYWRAWVADYRESWQRAPRRRSRLTSYCVRPGRKKGA